MKAEIISIGTELLMGELTDSNAPFIASRLPPLGIQLQWVSQVGDDLKMLADTFTRGMGRSDIIFSTGGLGPTQDDLTREAIARAVGEEMAVEDDLLEALKGYFRGRGIDMPATNIKQATLIPSARSIPNRRGTAPGWWVESGGKIIVSMPGPPSELHGIWAEEVVPLLQQKVRGEIILTRNIKTRGLSEGGVDEMVTKYLGNENPYLGIYAKPDGIHLRIIARAPSEDAAAKLIQPVEQGLTSMLGSYIWGYDNETPERTISDLLVQRGLTLATAEACSGGLLASSITDIPGSSGYFKGGTVIYGAESAIASGVPAAIIEEYGIISQQSAVAMATAARDKFMSDIGLAVAGVAGPEELEGKPVGLVHIAIALRSHGMQDGSVTHFPIHLPPRRPLVMRQSASTALIELRKLLNTL